ncbi:MAG: hypothetical protein HY811_11090 [Planctomycetes bacterium]|nr:hypothetical protein [Planctomycetota bacterium]
MMKKWQKVFVIIVSVLSLAAILAALILPPMHSNHKANEVPKVFRILFSVHNSQQTFFNANKRYGMRDELEKGYLTKDIVEMLNGLKVFSIVVWADEKSYLCLADTPSLQGNDNGGPIYKIDESGVLQRYEFYLGGSRKKYFRISTPDELFDFDNPMKEEIIEKKK